MLRQVGCVVGWLGPDSRLAFQHRCVRCIERTERRKIFLLMDVRQSREGSHWNPLGEGNRMV